MKQETVTMTPEELAEWEAFQAQRKAKLKAEKQAQDRESYKQLVDESIEMCFPSLKGIADQLRIGKKLCYDTFAQVVEMKADVYGVKDGQKSHAFTHRNGTMRIILGNYETDNYDDTVNVGIEKVKEYLKSLAKDNDSSLLVEGVLKLLSRDQTGNLKASRVLQLRKMAEQSGNEKFIDGVKIIEDAYRPAVSKTFVKAEYKNEQNEWIAVPLGMTEA
ncbi:DUF3164 family protein [Proteiniphilum sp.]|uniref:DUF3164 family protein n=1 Tax=Proteiniphilum sp. TaxID=1926877 RepID=UPI002B210C3F|nr:DUF3164 family protein [Proteiniphilum sp.]MEA4916309.1 DUF3164 family protein [Proteiniphilum sp.]